MSGKASKRPAELQKRLEGSGSEQDVAVFAFALQNVDATRLSQDPKARPDFERGVKKALATAAGVEAGDVAIAFAHGEEALAAEPGQIHMQEQQAYDENGNPLHQDKGAAHHQEQLEREDTAQGSNQPLMGGGGGGIDPAPTVFGATSQDAGAAAGKGALAAVPSAPWGSLRAIFLHCAVTPPEQAQSVTSSLGQLLKNPGRLTELLLQQQGVVVVSPKGVQVTDVVAPEVRRAKFPDLKLGKHGLPGRLFALLETAQACDDIRIIKTADGGVHPTGSEETNGEDIAWALTTIGEVFKDSLLEKLFVMVVTGLQQKDSRSCQQWAATISASTLRHVLLENPVRCQICKSGGAHQQQAQLQQYMQSCKCLVAIAAVAGEAQRNWNENFSPQDKAFLGDAVAKLGAWPDISVDMARGLWQQGSWRYVIIEALSRNQSVPEVPIRFINKCPKATITALFKAPWLGPSKEASFLYLYDAFARLDATHKGASEDIIRVLINAFCYQPEADFLAAVKALTEDFKMSARTKKDFLIALVSECRKQEEHPPLPELPQKGCCFWQSSQPVEETTVERTVPSTKGIGVMLLNAIVAAYGARENQRASGRNSVSGTDSRGMDTAPTGGSVVAVKSTKNAAASIGDSDLGELLETVLLLSPGDSLWEWVEERNKEDPREVECAQRFLRTVGVQHIGKILRVACDGKTPKKDDPMVQVIVNGGRLWRHEGQKFGPYSAYLESVQRKIQPHEISQILRMFVKLDMAAAGGGCWKLIQALEEGQYGCLASRLEKLAPPGGPLRSAIATDVKRGLGSDPPSVEQIERLLRHRSFFSLPMQALIRHDELLTHGRVCIGEAGKQFKKEIKTVKGKKAEIPSDFLLSLLEGISKIVSLYGGSDDLEQEVLDTFWEASTNCRTGGNVSWKLFEKILTMVQARDFKPGENTLALTHLIEASKELGKAGQILERKLDKAGGAKAANQLLSGVEGAITAALEQSKPDQWSNGLRSLDTVIFTLAYMGKEDLLLAMERFKMECRKAAHRRRLLWDLLACVNEIYRAPLAGTSMENMSPDMDMREFIAKAAPALKSAVWWRGVTFEPADWQRVLEIAGAAAECMRQKFKIVMIPHHTQVVAMLMFAFRACGVGELDPCTAQPVKLPKTMLARVGTGEGKSLIIGMLAAFVAKKGLRAHVINDQRVLTQRDFETNKALFETLGIKASSDPRDLRNSEVMIVYCSGDDVENSCLEYLVEGKADSYSEELKRSVLIVDEVDGMIFDKGPTSLKDFEDKEFSEWVNEWVTQLENTGKIERDYDDFRGQGVFSMAIQKEVEQAFQETFQKKEGVHYAERGGKLYMLDPKTNVVREEQWSLWLEILRRQRTGSSVQYRYTKAILCRLQCFMSYSCIFGLTGSLGQLSERDYLSEQYDAVTFNVPFFLDTCKSDDNGPSAKGDAVKVLSDKPLGKDAAEDQKRKGMLGTIGVVKEFDQSGQLASTEFGDGKSMWYRHADLAKVSSGKQLPKDIGDGQTFAGVEAQEQAICNMATHKCAEVPVLILAQNPDAVVRVAAQLRASLGADYGEGTFGVIELLHNPRNPQEFVEFVELSMEPLPVGDEGKNAWRITVTTAEGGRGHDYRCVDPAVDDAGGLLLILTWVPWSEREWIQFLGRTGRQDRAGQYAVMLNSQEEQVQIANAQTRQGERLCDTILRCGDEQSAKVLKGMGELISKARLMHRLTAFYWTLSKQGKTEKKQDWDWKALCAEYEADSCEAINQRFETVVPQTELAKLVAATPQQEPPKQRGNSSSNKKKPMKTQSMAELTCVKCGFVTFANWTPDQPPPSERCSMCKATTILSSFVPVYGTSV